MREFVELRSRTSKPEPPDAYIRAPAIADPACPVMLTAKLQPKFYAYCEPVTKSAIALTIATQLSR